MGKALELRTVQATAPGVGASFLAVSGDSLTVRDSIKPVWLGPIWQSRQAAGFVRITSPLLHDAVIGIQLQAPIGQSVSFYQDLQELRPQDTLLVFGSGSAVAGDLEQMSMLWLYEDLPGVDAYLIDRAELDRRCIDVYSFPNTLASGVAGGYSGSELVNSEVDQLKANEDYAIIGYDSTVACASIGYVSSDWGNIRVGGPGPVGGTSAAIQTRTWFRDLSDFWRMPLIPVFNASNKSLTFIDCVQDENGGDPVVTTICCRLRGRRGTGGGKRQ